MVVVLYLPAEGSNQANCTGAILNLPACLATSGYSKVTDPLIRFPEVVVLTVRVTSTTAEALDAVRNAEADFALLAIRTGYALISRDLAQRFVFVGPAITTHGLGDAAHIVLAKRDNALRLAVNKAIAGIKADGTFQRLMYRHFPISLD